METLGSSMSRDSAATIPVMELPKIHAMPLMPPTDELKEKDQPPPGASTWGLEPRSRGEDPTWGSRRWEAPPAPPKSCDFASFYSLRYPIQLHPDGEKDRSICTPALLTIAKAHRNGLAAPPGDPPPAPHAPPAVAVGEQWEEGSAASLISFLSQTRGLQGQGAAAAAVCSIIEVIGQRAGVVHTSTTGTGAAILRSTRQLYTPAHRHCRQASQS